MIVPILIEFSFCVGPFNLFSPHPDYFFPNLAASHKKLSGPGVGRHV